jgi:hypothetical protein
MQHSLAAIALFAAGAMASVKEDANAPKIIYTNDEKAPYCDEVPELKGYFDKNGQYTGGSSPATQPPAAPPAYNPPAPAPAPTDKYADTSATGAAGHVTASLVTVAAAIAAALF